MSEQAQAQPQPVEEPPSSGREALLQMRADRRKAERLQLREARAEQMLLRRLCGQRLHHIAQEFAVSQEVVAAELAWARQRGMQQKVRTYMEEKLWPKGLAGLEVHLDNGNYEAIRDLFQGTGVWNKNVAVTQTHALGEGVETFEAWRISRAQQHSTLTAQPQPQAQLPPPPQQGQAENPTTSHAAVIDVEVEDDVPQQQQPGR